MNKKTKMTPTPEKWNYRLFNFADFGSTRLEWRPPALNSKGDLALHAWNETGEADFLGIYRRDATPQRLSIATDQIISLAGNESLQPLLIAPYLSEEQLLSLEKRGLSALDLCGNGILRVGRLIHSFRTGFPNRFTASRPLKNAYRGVSSFAARSFVLRPDYAEVGDLQKEIERRGGKISLPTLSKALTELEADLVIERVPSTNKPQARTLRLIQPEKLIERLRRNYEPPKITQTFIGKSSLESEFLREALVKNAELAGVRLIATGIGSASRYAAIAMESALYVYTESLEAILDGLQASPTSRFPNLIINQTNDVTTYFDARLDEKGFPWASPLTAYLEMQGSEERMERSSEQVKKSLLASVSNRSEASA